MIYVCVWILIFIPFVSSKGGDCCYGIEKESCRNSCIQIFGLSHPIRQIQMLLNAADICPPAQVDFWQCLESSLPAVQQLSQWNGGRTCCDLAVSRECRRRCNNANSKVFLTRHCKEKDETRLFSCIKNQELSSKCCGGARSRSCGMLCQSIYLTEVSHSRELKAILSQHCHPIDKRVEECVKHHWQPQGGDYHRFVQCCERSEDSRCRQQCPGVLRSVMSDVEVVEDLSKVCSGPQATDPLWQCFLKNLNKNVSTPISRIDNAKLQCCSKASSYRCRELCSQVYRRWTSMDDFENSCSYQPPISVAEANMHNCLTDVDQPCKIGCSGLKFCKNFNNRPTELFRSCTREADQAAERAFKIWKKGKIYLPQLSIPVKDISRCKPHMWKAIACTLEVKPCSSSNGLITLCKEDCLYILTECVDSNKLPGEKTVPALCNALPSKNEPGACVSVDDYLIPSIRKHLTTEVNHPCNPNPCQQGEICQVRRRKCKHSKTCAPFVCHGACSLGQVSQVMVPKGTTVRLASINTDTGRQEDCHLVCQCNHRGKIDNCKSLPCVKRNSCRVSQGHFKNHNEHFVYNGRQCMCYDGSVVCNEVFSCSENPQMSAQSYGPGRCPKKYDPVCGSNGKTYPSVCVARCAGQFRLLETKACSEVDFCSHKPCPTGRLCVPRPQVCLYHGPCHQFECVDEFSSCNSHKHDPVCDNKDEEFTNACLLYAHQKTLAYRGHCQSSCSTKGVVCGHDGETYTSQCAALAARVTIDYFEACKAFGNITTNTGDSSRCQSVVCPKTSPKYCEGIVPPGGCCPVCASQILLKWDNQVLETAAMHTKSKQVTSRDVLTILSSQLAVLECDIYGYMSVSGDLVVLVAPISSRPPVVQYEACQSEADRLYNLFKTSSPHVASYLTLSSFLSASLRHSRVNAPLYQNNELGSSRSLGQGSPGAASLCISNSPFYLLCFFILQYALYHLENIFYMLEL